MLTSMQRISFLAFIFLAIVLSSKPASAYACLAAPTSWSPGSVVEVHYKAAVGAVCTYQLRGGIIFHGMEIEDYPKGIVDILNNPYALAFKMKKVGKYTIKAKFNITDTYGKKTFVAYIFYVEAVANEW